MVVRRETLTSVTGVLTTTKKEGRGEAGYYNTERKCLLCIEKHRERGATI